MNAKRWKYLKQLDVQPRQFHISAYARMKPNPIDPVGLPRVPWIENPGVTYIRDVPAHRKLHRTETTVPRV